MTDERTTRIVELFQTSWVDVERHYVDLLKYDGWERMRPLLSFIIQFRTTGSDRLFRAGTSMFTLLISRSIQHGLREDQKYISIEVLDIDSYEVKLREPLKTYREYRVKDLNDPVLHKLIKTLESTLVD